MQLGEGHPRPSANEFVAVQGEVSEGVLHRSETMPGRVLQK